MAKRKADPADELLTSARQGIQAVLKDDKATTAEKLKAIECSLKLLIVEKKLKGVDDDESFFPNAG
jgi:hypothetical protein